MSHSLTHVGLLSLQVQINLTSPQGTTSTLLQRRIKDNSMEGFESWAFMTTHSWGEMAIGTWTLEVENGESTCEFKDCFIYYIVWLYKPVRFLKC